VVNLRPRVRCPACRGPISGFDIKAGKPIPCRSCGAYFRVAVWYHNLTSWSVFAIAVGLLYALGVSGWPLALGAALLWFPVYVLWLFLFGHILPLQLEECMPPDVDLAFTRGLRR